MRTSTTPFKGCYNRSYYDRKGRYRRYYTSDANFGKKSGWNGNTIYQLVLYTAIMAVMIVAVAAAMVKVGGKVNGDVNRIKIEDHANVLNSAEEENVMALLHKVYDASGMPVTVYTDSFAWKEHYSSLEVYSEELYYGMGMDEDSMIILFTTNNDSEFYDWQYDMYCGAGTVKCLSDETFDRLLNNFQKGMASQSLYDALGVSWNSVMDDLATTSFDWSGMPMLIISFVFYGIIIAFLLKSKKATNDAYRYFKEHPGEYETTPMTLYSECPSCGATNTEQSETCPYCGTVLKISDGKVKFVKPK